MSILIGLLIGKFIPFIIGLYFMGIVASLMVSIALFVVFLQFAASPLLLICVMAVMTALCLMFTFYYKDIMCIVTTSFLGSYGFMRGWALLLGGFPSEVRLF